MVWAPSTRGPWLGLPESSRLRREEKLVRVRLVRGDGVVVGDGRVPGPLPGAAAKDVLHKPSKSVSCSFQWLSSR